MRLSVAVKAFRRHARSKFRGLVASCAPAAPAFLSPPRHRVMLRNFHDHSHLSPVASRCQHRVHALHSLAAAPCQIIETAHHREAPPAGSSRIRCRRNSCTPRAVAPAASRQARVAPSRGPHRTGERAPRHPPPYAARKPNVQRRKNAARDRQQVRREDDVVAADANDRLPPACAVRESP